MVSVVTGVGERAVEMIVAARPASSTHRFGHGKAEALAAIFQVMLIAVSAAGIAMRSGQALVEGERVAAAQEGIVVSVIAILATFALRSVIGVLDAPTDAQLETMQARARKWPGTAGNGGGCFRPSSNGSTT